MSDNPLTKPTLLESSGGLSYFTLRGLAVVGFPSQQAFLEHLSAGGCWLPGMLVAINAEKMLIMEQDKQVRALIESARFRYPDGISIVRAIQQKYPGAQVARIAGADLWEAVMEKAGRLGSAVFLIGARQEILDQTADKLRRQWNVNIVGTQNGYFPPAEQAGLTRRIAASGAEIVTVAMGSPRQEVLMSACQSVCPQALYMGVGGTYDVFTGHVKRAPKIWQRFGLEWLYRLLSRPGRLKRQLKLLTFVRWYLRRDF